MKVLIRLMMVSLLLIVAAPVCLASVVQVHHCEQDEDTTDDMVIAEVTEWLKAAKGMKGGENLEVYVNFPVAVNMGENDVTIVLVAPSFAEWGTFHDGLEGSAASKVQLKYKDNIDCPDSELWDSVEIK